MDLAQQLGTLLEPRGEVLFALLFGSRATGKARPDSDLDLAVYVDPALSARQRFDLRRQLTLDLEHLGTPDIVVLNDAPALLGHRALCGVRVLVRDRASLVRYTVRTLGQAGDERHWLRRHRLARARRLRDGTYGRP